MSKVSKVSYGEILIDEEGEGYYEGWRLDRDWGSWVQEGSNYTPTADFYGGNQVLSAAQGEILCSAKIYQIRGIGSSTIVGAIRDVLRLSSKLTMKFWVQHGDAAPFSLKS